MPPLPFPQIATLIMPLLEKNDKNNVMCLPSFISHPNGIVLHGLKQKRRKYTASKKRRSLVANNDERMRRRIDEGTSVSSTTLVEFLNESILDIEMKTENQRLAGVKERSMEQRLPRFISHPNGVVL